MVHSAQDVAASEHEGPISKPVAGQSLPLNDTLLTASVDTDSASVSANTSPEPASPPPAAHVRPSAQEAEHMPNQSQVGLKLLVSNSASGLIIGRSGSTISDLQAKSGTRIKLSQGGDYYPGTSDRVCLIQGFLSNASIAVELVLAKLYELQSLQHLASTQTPVVGVDAPGETASEEAAPQSFVVRLLVPSTCCGMIIGRGGSNVKALKEKSKVTYIQLSPKEHEVLIGGSTLSTSERIVTITGPTFQSCVDCVRIILNDMGHNPEISRYVNMTTSYTRNVAGMVAPPSAYTLAPAAPGFYVEHEPFPPHVLGQSPPTLESPPRYGMEGQFLPGQFDASSPGHLTHQGSPTSYDAVGHPPMVPSQSYEQDPIAPGSSFPQYQQPTFWAPDASSGSPGRRLSGGNIPSIDQLAQSFQAQASLPRHPSHSSLHSQTSVSVQLGVHDTRIGSILGRGGKTLTEIQALSKTKIRISQRGEFIPGTHNRVVTITGNSLQEVEHAQHLVNQRLTASFSRSGSSSDLRQDR
ncbi:hypothetical protein ACHAXT_012667 [Thalassiosira profunda]